MDGSAPDAWIAEGWYRASRADDLTSDDRVRVKDAIKSLYRLAGLTPPEAIVWGRSPQEVMAMAVAHQEQQATTMARTSARISNAIGEHQQQLLDRVPFTGLIADRVDNFGVTRRAWGTELHPDMLRSPGAGNLRSGVAAEVSWILDTKRFSASAGVEQGLRALVARSLAGPARFLDDIAFVSELPIRFLSDEEGRPHHDAGAAVQWADGKSLHFWHGTRVPADFLRWTAERALAEVNVEVRRCAFERLGVDGLEQSLSLLAEAPDPANPPYALRLYDLPRPWLNGRLLVVDNASIDKGGHRRRFQLFVPPHITDPVEAAANSFGMTVEQYVQLQRAT